jgi:TPR repeat protein
MLKRLRVTNNPKLTSLPAALCQQFAALDDRLQVDDTLQTLITAAERFTDSAESGDDKAQVLLAQCYLQGRGVEPNAELAASWFGKAADQGNTVGHWKLGMCYAEGVGIVKSVRRAVKHFRARQLE